MLFLPTWCGPTCLLLYRSITVLAHNLGYTLAHLISGKDKTLGLVSVSRLKEPRLSVLSRYHSNFDDWKVSVSDTSVCLSFNKSWPDLVTKYWKSGKIVKVSSHSCLSLETKGTRLSVLSRSRPTFDYQKVSVLDSSICWFPNKSHSRSRLKILVSSLPPSSQPVKGVMLSFPLSVRSWYAVQYRSLKIGCLDLYLQVFTVSGYQFLLVLDRVRHLYW
jgi:hypothetical protein